MSISELSDNTLFWGEPLAGDLLRFFRSRLRCPEAAADLRQETYLRLDGKITNYSPDHARALAFRIALNLAIDYQRRVSVRARYASTEEFDSIMETVSDHSSQPERSVMAQQQLALLDKALQELPANCRAAFYLHSSEGLSYSEIAEHMQISKTMVNKLISQAMLHCSEQLEN